MHEITESVLTPPKPIL